MTSVVEAFEELCWQIRDIDRRNISEYPRVELLGRDCYLWNGYVVKSSPEKWNFKNSNELRMLRFINSHVGSQHFTELIADVKVDNRIFILLKYIPYASLSQLFYNKKRQRYTLLPGVIRAIENEGKVILQKLDNHRIIHRDITPDNLLFDYWHGRLVLIDFGYAIHEGEEIQIDNKATENLLKDILKHNLGGKYRKPDAKFSFETDKYSFNEIVQELKSISSWCK